MMRKSRDTKRFRRGYNKLARSGLTKLVEHLDKTIFLLMKGEILDESYRDHALKGRWEGCRECHVQDDWLLIYELHVNSDGEEVVTFHATGSHTELFD